MNVAYVDPGGTDNASCTKAMPCTKVAKALLTDPGSNLTGVISRDIDGSLRVVPADIGAYEFK